MKSILALVICIVSGGYAVAQSTTETKTAPPPLTAKVRSATVAPSATTTYTQPGKGADGPIPGNQRGSSTSTSYGATVTIPLPEKKK